MQIDECIRHIGGLLNLNDLAVNDEGGCQIVFDEEFPVDLEFDAERDLVYLSSLVLPAEQQEPEAHARALMGNAFGLMTADAAFALDPVTRDLLLTLKLPLGSTTVDTFAEILAGFVGMTQAWRQDLAEGRAAPPPTGIEPGMIQV